MKHKQHKSILLCAPIFPSDSISEGNILYLKAIYQEFVEEVSLRRYTAKYSSKQILNLYQGEDAVLVIGNARRHPKSFFEGPYIEKNNRKTPIAWMPYRTNKDIKQFADMVKEVHQRTQDDCVVALLSQRHPRFVRIVDRMNKILQKELKPLKWSSDVIVREEMTNALEQGVGLATYFGHGRPIGWVGYYGFRAHHFNLNNAKPIGGLLSLCCKTASRKRTPLSFCEQLVLDKKCAATFGAVDSTLHTCLLYTSPSPRDKRQSRMPSSA